MRRKCSWKLTWCSGLLYFPSICWFSLQNCCYGQDWARQKLTKSFIQVSYVGGSDLNTWSVLCYFPQAISRELAPKWSSKDTNWSLHGMLALWGTALPTTPQSWPHAYFEKKAFNQSVLDIFRPEYSIPSLLKETKTHNHRVREWRLFTHLFFGISRFSGQDAVIFLVL